MLVLHTVSRSSIACVFNAGSAFELGFLALRASVSVSVSVSAQSEVWRSLRRSAQRLASPPLLSPPGGDAWRGSLEEALRAGNTAPLDVDALALPPDGFSPVPLADLEAKCGRKLVEGLTNAIL